MLKVILLSVLLYFVCLSNIVDGRHLKRAFQKVTVLQKVQNNIRSLLNKNIGKELVVKGETYVITGVLGIVPQGVPAHKYSQYWDDAKFLNTALIQLQFDVEKVGNIDTAVVTKETYVFSDASYIAKGTYGKVYKAIKYKATGAKDTTKEYVVKEMVSLVAAKKECDEYEAAPRSEYICECFGTAEYSSKGYAVLDNAGPDIDNVMKAGAVSESDRKAIVKGMLTGLKLLNDNTRVHTDIKPGNVCFRNSKVKLIDFGAMKNWGTFAVLANADKLENYWKHLSPFYLWNELKPLFEYKVGDQTSDLTKQAYIDRIKPKIYLVDFGGIFVTHLETITKFSDQDIEDHGDDIYTYFDDEVARVDVTTGTFWARHTISDNEKAVLLALRDPSKTYADVLAMTWLA